MKLKGMDKFREKLPVLRGKRFILLPIFAISCIILVFLALFGFLRLSTDITLQISGINLNWLVPILGMVFIEFGGLFLVFQMWYWRDQLKAKYPETAYQRIVFLGFAGIICMICIAFFQVIPLTWSNPSLNSVESIKLFNQPLSQFWFSHTEIFDLIRIISGITITVLGISMILRSVFTFGFDYMTVVYLYYPEESTIQNHKIYSVLRHPTYAALIYISFAGILIQFSLYSIIFFFLYLFGFLLHIRKVEEKELLQRFGESYETYRKQVPAILVHPRQWKVYFKFLLGKE
jgi:protein-S-isoprenylcysteine O-methyltransferase Ste14